MKALSRLQLEVNGLVGEIVKATLEEPDFSKLPSVVQDRIQEELREHMENAMVDFMMETLGRVRIDYFLAQAFNFTADMLIAERKKDED